MTRKVLKTGIAIAVVTSMSGCAIFSSKDDAPASQSAGFQGVAQTTAGSLPLPVEVAHDISRIYNGQEPTAEPDQEPAPVDDFERVVKGAKRKPASVASSPRRRSPAAQAKSGSGQDDSYTVRDGDTLMKISFEKYGNLYRWREIYDANKGKIGNANKLVAGTILTIQGVEYVVVEHNGKPYLIRRNDTLTKISSDVYGTPKEWRALWNNNRQLIHDPNKIYAGFTLYYVPKDQVGTDVREPASAPVKKKKPVKKTAAQTAAAKLPAREEAAGPAPTSVPTTVLPEDSTAKKQVALVSDDPGVLPPDKPSNAQGAALPSAPPSAPPK